MSVFLKPYSDLIALLTGNAQRLNLSSTLNKIALKKSIAKQNILVTGANGFVGLHLIRELTSRDEISQIHAFVRAENDTAALKRLIVSARRFGLTISNQDKLHVHGGIFSPDEKSLRTEQFANEIDSVIHAAGSTSHVKPYLFYRNESVFPLVRLMEFTQIGKHKSLHIIGSIGADIYSQLRDFFKLSFFHCGYSRMKWVTRRMTQVAHQLGLSTFMYLPSYVIGSACTDYRDPGMRYAFWQMLRLCNDIGMIWDSGTDAISVVTGEDLAKKIVNNLLDESSEPCIYPSSYVNTQVIAERFGWQHVSWTTFYNTLKNRHSLLKQRSARTLQDRLAARLLFPKNLPEIIHSTSQSMKQVELNKEIMESTANTIFKCAQKNYLFNRK